MKEFTRINELSLDDAKAELKQVTTVLARARGNNTRNRAHEKRELLEKRIREITS